MLNNDSKIKGVNNYVEQTINLKNLEQNTKKTTTQLLLSLRK